MDYVRISVQLPRPLYEQVARQAEDEHRSVSGQVVHLVARAVQEETEQTRDGDTDLGTPGTGDDMRAGAAR